MSEAACETPKTADEQLQYVTNDSYFSISTPGGKTHLVTEFGITCHSRDKML